MQKKYWKKKKERGKKLTDKNSYIWYFQHVLENLNQDRCKLEILTLMETSAFITPFSLHLTNHSWQRESQILSTESVMNWEEDAVSGCVMKQQGSQFH